MIICNRKIIQNNSEKLPEPNLPPCGIEPHQMNSTNHSAIWPNDGRRNEFQIEMRKFFEKISARTTSKVILERLLLSLHSRESTKPHAESSADHDGVRIFANGWEKWTHLTLKKIAGLPPTFFTYNPELAYPLGGEES